MRFLLTFLGLFTPLAWLLWFLAGDLPMLPDMQVVTQEDAGDPVFDTSDMPRIPVRGEITRMADGLFERFHETENYVIYWVSFKGIERVDGKARIEGISCALFGAPKDGRENLRVRLEAPYLEGDPVTLIAAQREGATQLVLGGGVKVYDELGRLSAELERVEIDLEAKTIRSEGEVFFRSPQKDTELRGRGLESDLALLNAKLLHDVRARLPLGEGTNGAVSLACDGPATMVRDEKAGTTVVTLENSARIDHRDVRATCGIITVRLREGADEKPEIDSIVLEKEVVFELDPALADGLEEFRAHRITISGDTEILVEGLVAEGHVEPVRAVRRGPLEVFGLADRVLDIDTPRIFIRLLPAGGSNKRADTLALIRFPDGVNVRDREGPGRISAGWLEYDAHGGRLEAKRDVIASAPGRRLEADRISVRRPPGRKDVVALGIFGTKKLELSATGKLGPLARGDQDHYTFTCNGPLYLESYGNSRVAVIARDEVVVAGRTQTLLHCGRVLVLLLDNEVRRVEASGGVSANDPETGASFACERLNFTADREKEIVLRGEPAVVRQPDRTVRARVLVYTEGGTFVATGGVDADVTLQGKVWKFHADDARGIAPKAAGAPPRFLATGAVRAEGPEGERLSADRMEYVRARETLTLTGSPARLRQGDAFSYEGAGLQLGIVEEGRGFSVVAAKTAGPAKLVVAPKKDPQGAPNRVARWEIDLRGPTRLENDSVLIPHGAALRAFDQKGALVLKGESKEIRIDIERTKGGFVPLKLICREGVQGETFKKGKRAIRFEASALTYVVNARDMDVRGPGKIWQGQDKLPTLIAEAQFELTDDGVDLKYMRGLAVPAPKR